MCKLMPALALASALVLPGCLPMIAASAVGTAVRTGTDRGPIAFDASLRNAGMEACRTHAAGFGTPNVIDAEMRRGNAVRVYGTVEGPPERRSFVCDYRSGGRVARFDLRPIARR